MRARAFGGAHSRATNTSTDHSMAQAVLPDAAYKLFEEMPPGDRTHVLCVLRALREKGPVLPDVEQAALLHDVGKVGGGLTLLHRALIVLLSGVNAHWLDRLGTPDPVSWRYPFYVHGHHAELGARRCEQAGCSPLLVALVRHHESALDIVDDPGLREQLAVLRMADDKC